MESNPDKNKIRMRHQGGGHWTVTSSYWADVCDRDYRTDETCVAHIIEERSMKEHNLYFACLNEAWNNLPENIANRFPTVTHMRKIGLIECGYYNERMIVLPDHESAKNVATFVGDDQYAVISVVTHLAHLAMGF